MRLQRLLDVQRMNLIRCLGGLRCAFPSFHCRYCCDCLRQDGWSETQPIAI